MRKEGKFGSSKRAYKYHEGGWLGRSNRPPQDGARTLLDDQPKALIGRRLVAAAAPVSNQTIFG